MSDDARTETIGLADAEWESIKLLVASRKMRTLLHDHGDYCDEGCAVSGFLRDAIDEIVAAHVRSAVEQERAAWAARIEALAGKLEKNWQTNPVAWSADYLRSLLTSDSTAALDAVKAEAWDEAAEAVADWMSNNPSPSGIPHDPPTNPYDRADQIDPANERSGP